MGQALDSTEASGVRFLLGFSIPRVCRALPAAQVTSLRPPSPCPVCPLPDASGYAPRCPLAGRLPSGPILVWCSRLNLKGRSRIAAATGCRFSRRGLFFRPARASSPGSSPSARRGSVSGLVRPFGLGRPSDSPLVARCWTTGLNTVKLNRANPPQKGVSGHPRWAHSGAIDEPPR